MITWQPVGVEPSAFNHSHNRWQDRWKEATGNFVPEGMTQATSQCYPSDKRRQVKEQEQRK